MKERLAQILKQIEKIGGDARLLVFEDPAQIDEVHEIEQQLNYKIPDDFKLSSYRVPLLFVTVR